MAHRLKLFRPRNSPLVELVRARQSSDQPLERQVSRNPAVPAGSAMRSQRMYRRELQVGEHNRVSVLGRKRLVGAANQIVDRELMEPQAVAVAHSPPPGQVPLRVELPEALPLALGSELCRVPGELPRTLARPDVHCDAEDRAYPVPHLQHRSLPPNHVENQVPGE